MYDELQQGMEYIQEATVRFDRQLRSRVLHAEMDIATEKLNDIWQRIDYIEDKTTGRYPRVQQGMENIKLGMVYIQQVKEKCFETGHQSDKLEVLRQGKEYVKQGREYVQQGIKYIKEITSDMYPEVLPGPRFEDYRGKDFIREASGSGSTNPVRQQERQSYKSEVLRQGKEYVKQGREYIQQGIKYIKEIRSDMHPKVLPGPRFEDRQRKEYIREASGSGSTNPVHQQERGLEDQPRILEYFREADRSGTNHVAQPKSGYVEWQKREYIQDTNRSDRTNPVPRQDHRLEDRQGLEFIRQAEKSAGTYPVRQQDHMFENGQGMEYIRQAEKSASTNSVRQQHHIFENAQGMEYIRQPDRSASTNTVRQQDHRFENRQGMEYIRQAEKSATNHVRPQDHGFEVWQGLEYIHEADPRSGTSQVFQLERGREDW